MEVHGLTAEVLDDSFPKRVEKHLVPDTIRRDPEDEGMSSIFCCVVEDSAACQIVDAQQGVSRQVLTCRDENSVQVQKQLDNNGVVA